MKYKVNCNSHPDGCDDCGTFDSYSEALSIYNIHNEKNHDVSMVPVASLDDDEVEGFAPFRIGKGSKKVADKRINARGQIKTFTKGEIEDEEEPESTNKKYNNYFQKLVTLIPSEVLGVYLTLYSTGKGTANVYTDSNADIGWLFWISIIGLVLVFISRIFGTKKTGFSSMSHFDTVQWRGVIISAISFVIWLYAMGHQFASFEIPDQRIVFAAVILWTFLIPFIYKGDGEVN